MQSAARKLSSKYNIPGFRKGKAPYRVVVGYFGEAAILEEAVEVLGNAIYKDALDESGLNSYGMGQLEDFKVEDDGKAFFKFIVPLQPEVELGDYRSVRVDYKAPEITDKDVDTAMKSLREQHAVIEESSRPVEMGNRITAYLDARLIEDEATGEAEAASEDAEPVAEAADAGEEGDEHDHEHEHEHHVDEKTIIHEHAATIILDDEAVAPGFAEALVGANVGDVREFELTYPDDEDEYGDIAGKRVKFHVEIQKIENVTLPALNDEFAQRVTAEEEKPLTLLELRMRMRENLERAEAERVKNVYTSKVLDKMLEGATIKYPDAMVADQVQSYIERFDADLRKQGLTVEDYKRIYQKTDDDLFEAFQEPATNALRRALLLRALVEAEGIQVSEEDIEAAIDRAASQFGERAQDYRRLFDLPNMRDNMRNDLLNDQLLDRIAAIGRNEAPELPQPVAAADSEAEAQTTAEDVQEEKGETS